MSLCCRYDHRAFRSSLSCKLFGPIVRGTYFSGEVNSSSNELGSHSFLELRYADFAHHLFPRCTVCHFPLRRQSVQYFGRQAFKFGLGLCYFIRWWMLVRYPPHGTLAHLIICSSDRHGLRGGCLLGNLESEIQSIAKTSSRFTPGSFQQDFQRI